MHRRLLAVMLAALVLATPLAASARRRPQPTPSPTRSPSPLPTPPSEAMRFAQLHRDIAEISATAPGRLGIAVVDLAQYTRFTARGDEAFPLASVVKLAIAVVAFRRADQRKLDLEQRIEVAPSDLRAGVSPIATMHPHGGVSYTYAELIRAMLLESDNTASDLVLRAVGGAKAVDAFLTGAGLPGFDVRKSEADLARDARAHRTFATGADNGATPNAVANLLTGIANGEFLRLDTNTELLTLLAEVQTGTGRLRAGLPPNALLAHKTGTSDTFAGTTDATNDAGILTVPEGRRVVIVAFLAESKADEATRDAVLARVARAVYHAYVP